MTSLAEAESKYGHVVQSAGGQIFGIERAASAALGRQAEKLTIGTPDGFIKIDVVLNQPDIDAVLRERTAGRRQTCSRAQDAFAAGPGSPFPCHQHPPKKYPV